MATDSKLQSSDSSTPGFNQFGGISTGYTGTESFTRQAAVQTTDATVTDIATIAVAEDEAFVVEGRIVAIEDDGSESVGGTFMGVFRRDTGGNVTLVGSVTTDVQHDSGGAPTFTLAADTTNQTIDIQVTGVAATTMNWVVTYTYHKVTTSTA